MKIEKQMNAGFLFPFNVYIIKNKAGTVNFRKIQNKTTTKRILVLV